MNKILGMDSAYDEAVAKRGRNMLISANLVAEMTDRIRQLEVDVLVLEIANDKDFGPVEKAKSLALYLENNIGSKFSCLREDLEDFITEMEG